MVLSNSCSWICDTHSQHYYRKSGAGSKIFLDGSYSRGKESLGCHSRGLLGLEDKKTAQKNCTMEKSWSRYYFSINKRQEVSCGSCVSSWELTILSLLSSFSGGLLNEVLLPMASQSALFPNWVTDPQGADLPPVPLSPCMAPPWVIQMPECLSSWPVSTGTCLTGLHTPSVRECATDPGCFIFPAP